MIKIGPVDVSAVKRGLEQRAVLAKRDALQLGKVLGPQYVKGNFRRQEGPEGKWKETKRGGRIFYDKLGRMEKGITAEIRGEVVWIGAGEATAAYNAAHNFGATTKAHVIRPRNKKALAWPGGSHPVKKVNHPGSKIPRRTFMYLRDQDRASLVKAMQTLYVKRLDSK